tara:strand:+ start:4990 stop:5223 length:234 start_codon:yes stop_codon:yes gene_type:complete
MIQRYVSAEGLKADDFGVPFTMRTGERVYDARTLNGQWATMTHSSWLDWRAMPRLGTGYGQRYIRQANGELHKEAGK